MIYSHDEVELIDVLTLMEAVSKKAGSAITARQIADCHLAIKWFHELADFSGSLEGTAKFFVDQAQVPCPVHSDYHWDGPVVMESLSSIGAGSLANAIYLSPRLSRSWVKTWIMRHRSWKVKADG